MKVLTKELNNKLELHELHCALASREKRTLPVFFLNGNCGTVDETDVKTANTKFNFTEKENELKFMLLPSTFPFYSEHFADAEEREMRSLEEDFLSQYVNRLRIISYLPDEILEQVKDKRLLALGYAEEKVKKTIIEYIDAEKTAALKTLKDSINESLIVSSELTIGTQFKKRLYINSIVELLDEVKITNVERKDNELYIELDNEETFVLTDAETLEEEINAKNTAVEKFELHKTEQGYELHLLLMTQDESLVESFHCVTYGFKDMKFKM